MYVFLASSFLQEGRKIWKRNILLMSSPTRSLFTPGKPSSSASEPAASVKALAAHLKRTSPADLRNLSSDTLKLAMEEMKMPADQRADVDLWMHALAPSAISSAVSSDTSTLANAVERQRLAQVFPWMPQEEAALRQIQRLADDWNSGADAALKALKEEFESKARAGLLGALESLIGQYCLYCTDPKYAAYLLMALLLRIPAAQRIPVHNWMVAGDMARATKESFGSAIAILETPLFPVCAGLQSANMKLLESALSRVSPPEVSGGGWLPVAQIDGSWGVDTSPLESAFAAELANVRTQTSHSHHHQQPRPADNRRGPRYAQPAYHHQHSAYPQQQSRQPHQQTRRYGPRGAGPDHHDPDALLDALFAPASPAPSSAPVQVPSAPPTAKKSESAPPQGATAPPSSPSTAPKRRF
jgi:hypothetical protein